MPTIHIITNPRSGRNLKKPHYFEHLYQLAQRSRHPDNHLFLYKPNGLEALQEVINKVHAHSGDVLCIHGGDGTVHQVMTALWRTYGTHTSYPKIAILKGGTMNNIARNVGVTLWSTDKQLLMAIAQNQPAQTSIHHPIVVDESQSGFIYGSVALAPFMDVYETGPERPSPWKGFKMFIRTIFSVIFNTQYSQDILAPVTFRMHFDQDVIEPQAYTMLGISSIADVGFYFRPFYKTLQQPNILQCLAMNCSPMHIVWSVPKLALARPTNSPKIIDRTGQRIQMEYTEPLRYTIDGDVYTSGLTQTIALGPAISFLHL